MMVVCAWCEQEGGPALLRERAPCDQSPPSHGICDVHEQMLLMHIHNIRETKQIRHIPRRLCLSNARGDRSPITVRYLTGND
jgi:hypothetical protein